jgi:tetratricopeptide (TPR) repeat protein
VATLAQAIETGKSSIVFLEGVAGIGKTFLLEETERIAHDQEVLCPPLVDFYDTRVHSHQALQEAIADALDANPEGAFRTYRQRRRRAPGDELWQEFLDGYRTAVGNRRVMLRFDTAERLVYERDSGEVLLDCEVEELDAPSWNWLLRRIGELPNTTVLIAARPTPAGLLLDRLQAAYGEQLRHIGVKGFDLEETQSYFRAIEFGRQIADESPEMVEKVYLLSDGRPILIALALDWLARGMWDPRLYPADVAELREWKAQAGANQRTGEIKRRWDEITRQFEMRLVEQIRNLASPLDVAVRYVALCRKGCNPELLARLMGIDLEEARALVEQLLVLSFVKPPRPGSHGMFFLHDEMYDLVENYVWLVDWPDYVEQKRLDHVIIGWYSEQIDNLGRQIKTVKDLRDRRDLRTQQQLLIAERLYYQFDENPRRGYREYSHVDEEAIGSREHQWDVWLRNEALWFTSHRAWRRGQVHDVEEGYPRNDPAWMRNGSPQRNPTVDDDCRRRWVSRFIARDDRAKAARVAANLLNRSPRVDEPELYRPALHIGLVAVQAYLGGERVKEALDNFNEGMQALIAISKEHQETWLHPYIMGSAHLYKGLALRNALRLKEAADSYGKATRYYGAINFRSGLAEAMNNLAYIYARLGRLEPAQASCGEALRIRQELGDEYNVGLSFNTKGIIYERMDRPITAIKNSEQALTLFKEINDERGIILAEINLGRSYRRKARSPEWGQEDEDFEKGKAYLEDSIQRQEKQGASAELFYRIEAYNELGCLYRDWVAILHSQRSDDSRLVQYLDEAEKHLSQAIELARGKELERTAHLAQYVDSLEDLARVHYWRARTGRPCPEGEPLGVMRKRLQEAETLIEERQETHEELRLIRGKIHFQYARLAREGGAELNEVVKQYALAAGHATTYSLDAPESRKFAAEACDWLSKLTPEEARTQIDHMKIVLSQNNLEGIRLKEQVDSVVRNLLGVGWDEGDQEVTNG